MSRYQRQEYKKSAESGVIDCVQSRVCSGREVSFIEILNDHFLLKMNFIPTRGDKVLDLVLTSVPDLIRVTEVLSPEQSGIFTDHGVVCFDLNAFVRAPARSHHMVYNYLQGDFEGLHTSPYENVWPDFNLILVNFLT